MLEGPAFASPSSPLRAQVQAWLYAQRGLQEASPRADFAVCSGGRRARTPSHPALAPTLLRTHRHPHFGEEETGNRRGGACQACTARREVGPARNPDLAVKPSPFLLHRWGPPSL